MKDINELIDAAEEFLDRQRLRCHGTYKPYVNPIGARLEAAIKAVKNQNVSTIGVTANERTPINHE